jgi:hypothetical protein
MNPVAIVLGIVIIILAFVLYRFYTSTATALQTSLISLKTPPQPITSISSATSNQYAYGIWLYVNSWDPTVNKVILNHKGAMTIYLMAGQPSLVVDVQMSDNSTASTVITNNFPLQKWVFIIASLDNQFLDVYLDGKLVKSAKLTNANNVTFPIIPPATPFLYLGNNNGEDQLYNGVSGSGKPPTSTASSSSGFDAYVTYLYRWTVAMDPGTAWQYYMKGNGQTTILGAMNNYGVQMQVLQNDVVASSYRII